MSISNYSELVAAIESVADRDDLDTFATTAIQLAEARLNRLLDDPEMEVTSVTVASSAFTALPSDFGSMVSVSTGDGALPAVGQVEFASFDQSISGTPRFYVITDGTIGFAPANSSATITMVYRRRIPALTALAPTNWLLSLAPDAYYHAVLAEVFAWDHDEDRAAMHSARAEQIIGELAVDASRRKWGAGPIAPRIRRA